MKKIFIIISLALFSVYSYAEDKVQKSGSEYSFVKEKQPEEKTPFTFKAQDGEVYDIYISKNGSCYIKRISKKSGSEYRYYLGKEISMDICSQLGREYNGKQ